MLAARAGRIAVSPTMKVAAEAIRLKTQGVDVIDFGAGEPDFPTPTHIAEAAKAAIDANFTKYTANSGTEDLKRAVAARYREDYGVEYATSEIIITAGGKQALYNAVMVLFGPGDEVITHMPGWPTLVEQIKLADATPVVVRTHAEDGFHLRADTILSALTPRTRGIIINSPGNPTGALIAEDDLGAIADEAARRGIWVLMDLCYEKLIYDQVPHNVVGMPERAAPRSRGPVRLRLEGVCDDRMALRMDDGARRGGRRRQRPAEPLDVQRLLDHAARGTGRDERTTGMRDRDARRIPQASRSAERVARRRAAAADRQAGRRLLPVP